MDFDDSFTDKLLKRTKARKDYLKVKMMDSPARKKRSALVEEQQIPNQDNKEQKEPPKCLRVKQVVSEYEVKENVSVKQHEMKENNYMKEDDGRPMEEKAPLRARGLAPLTKKHSVQDGLNERKVSQDTQQMDKPLTYVFSTNSRELCSTRNRLARLAANINGWEDNLKRSAVPATSSCKEAPAVAAEEVEDTLNRSFEPSNLPMSARKALFEKAVMENNKVQSEKQAFEPKVSVARRAAMFENAPNTKFRTAHQKTANASPVKPNMKVGSPVKPAAAPAKPSAVLKGSPARQFAALTKSPTKSSTGSPVKSSPAFSRDTPAKPGANGRRTTTPTKSFIPKPPIFPSQQQWAKTVGMELEKKLPLSRLVDHWEKLSLLSSVTKSQLKEVAKK